VAKKRASLASAAGHFFRQLNLRSINVALRVHLVGRIHRSVWVAADVLPRAAAGFLCGFSL
jgi:hypothetical protein